jgi:hypothetical protein
LDEEIEREFGQSEEIEAKALPWAPVVDAEADADAEPDPASEAAPD